MGYSNQFFSAVNVDAESRTDILRFAKATGITIDRLKYYNASNVLPSGEDLKAILKVGKISELELMLKMGRINNKLMEAISINSKQIAKLVNGYHKDEPEQYKDIEIVFETKLGKLYHGDCLSVIKKIDSESVDTVFADPPFNLSKLYPSNIDDNIKTEKYINWCQDWLYECARILKHGGALFLWNLPKWNAVLTDYIGNYLTFRHWIGVDIKYTLPISGRLYPSHYSLLYYIKGNKPKTFHPDRLPMRTCPKCYGDLTDYGGYKNKMNPLGVNLSDIWTDIPPVRHAKYKRREGANELSLKLMDRIIEMSTNEGDIVFDPFGGSGTTYMAAELKGRKWIGCEIGPSDDIVNRFAMIEEERAILEDYRAKINKLFPDNIHAKRIDLGLWVCESFHNDSLK
jgi:site-specific DNA-methyltransferase (adenine-specific)